MNGRWMGTWAVAVCAMATALTLNAASAVCGQELATDAEQLWRELRSSSDVRTKLLAERWYNVVKLQEWSNDTGKFTTNAKYLEHDPDLGWVKLRIIQGTGRERVVKEVTIPLAKLSKTCQARVRQIHALSAKLAEAKVEEEKRQAEEKDGAPPTDSSEVRAGEMPAEELEVDRAGNRPDRRGRSEFEDGRTGSNPEDALSQAPMAERSEAAATNTRPPLPVALPPLPSRGETVKLAAATAGETRPDADAVARAAGGATAFEHPTSAEGLKAVFEKAFAARDKVTLESLFYWDDVQPDKRQQTFSSLIDYADRAQLLACELQSFADGGSLPDFTIESATYFRIEFETESANHSIRWPYGEVEGKFYLGAWSPIERR